MVPVEDAIYLQSVAPSLFRAAGADRALRILLALIAEHRDLRDAVRDHHARRNGAAGHGPVDLALWQAAGLEPDVHVAPQR